ncbi:MAG: hypothetical protein CVV42_15950 [Candidatus Riflebacteria bacterium HGW-Riflebacteria-2]|nr:MAG: hypothetical protein CVV42_15950 [Candidatus Riflebacteria bacterium HGW-Riflebacteria-2]
MSVSCNCQDFDGAGRLGDLSINSLTEILSGEKAQYFRKTLAEGKLPLLNCTRCVELEMVASDQALEASKIIAVPHKNIMIENTILCGCNCLSCARPQVMRNRKKLALSLDDIGIIAEEIKRHGISSLAYFNLGDPFLSSSIYDELALIKKVNPHLSIYTSTNGLYLDSPAKFEAALLTDRIGISIDGIDSAMVRKYQRNGDFERSFGNMCRLVSYRNKQSQNKTEIMWNYILFNWNDKPKNIIQAQQLARQAGIDTLSLCHTKSPLWGTSWRWYTNKFYREIRKGQSSQFLAIPIV